VRAGAAFEHLGDCFSHQTLANYQARRCIGRTYHARGRCGAFSGVAYRKPSFGDRHVGMAGAFAVLPSGRHRSADHHLPSLTTSAAIPSPNTCVPHHACLACLCHLPCSITAGRPGSTPATLPANTRSFTRTASLAACARCAAAGSPGVPAVGLTPPMVWALPPHTYYARAARRHCLPLPAGRELLRPGLLCGWAEAAYLFRFACCARGNELLADSAAPVNHSVASRNDILKGRERTTAARIWRLDGLSDRAPHPVEGRAGEEPGRTGRATTPAIAPRYLGIRACRLSSPTYHFRPEHVSPTTTTSHTMPWPVYLALRVTGLSW